MKILENITLKNKKLFNVTVKMKIIIVEFYFLIVHVLQKGYCESVPNIETSLTTLTNLQMEHCSSPGMCTINASNNATTEKIVSNCCKACSCVRECRKFGNCCPDFHITRLLNDGNLSKVNPSFNLSELFKNFIAAQQNLHDIRPLLEIDSAETQNDKFACVRSKAINKDFHMEREMYPLAYRMIASCQMNFNGTADLNSKCTAGMQVEPINIDNVGPDRVVPVTSLKTNKTYKNIYCLLCNEGNGVLQDVIQWDVIFISLNNYHLLDDTYEPYSILNTMTSGGVIYGSNIIYQPSNQIAHIVTRCRKVDVKTCPDDTNIDILTVCKMYYLPVVSKVRYNKEYLVYNNIACYLCNNKHSFKASCEKDYQQGLGYSMQLNFPIKGGPVSTIIRYNSSEHHPLNISFTEKGRREKCEQGFVSIYERVSDSCRLVLCPANFYPVNGSCIPTYHKMTNVSFTIVLEVIRALKTNERELFYKAYTNIVENLITNLSVNFTSSLWKFTNTSDVLVVTMTKSGSTYIDLIETMSYLLNKLTFQKISTNSRSIEVVTSFFKDNSKPKLISGRLYTRYTKGKGNILLEKLYDGGEISNKMTDIKIDKVHLCYRVKLESSDVIKIANGIFVLNKTGLVLTFANLRRTSSFGVTSCIDEANEFIEDAFIFGIYSSLIRQKINYFKKQIMSAEVHSTDDSKTDESSEITFPNELVIFIVFAGVVMLTCLLRYLSVKREQRNDRQT